MSTNTYVSVNIEKKNSDIYTHEFKSTNNIIDNINIHESECMHCGEMRNFIELIVLNSDDPYYVIPEEICLFRQHCHYRSIHGKHAKYYIKAYELQQTGSNFSFMLSIE